MNVSTVEAREKFSDVINRAAYGKERVILTRRGKPIVAVVPIDDIELLEALENRMDLEAAREALRETGTIPLAKVKAELGLWMAYEVAFKPSAFRSLANFPKAAQKRILTKIESLAEKPFPPGVKKLKGEEDLYRIRAGDYRVIYQVQSELLLVLVVRIGHRKEIYQ